MDENIALLPTPILEDVDDDDAEISNQIIVANLLRLRRHELQHALLVVKESTVGCGDVASRSDVEWVHDQVMSRPFMARVVTKMFGQQRGLNGAQVVSLKRLAAIVSEIEGLAAQLPMDGPRVRAASSMWTAEQEA